MTDLDHDQSESLNHSGVLADVWQFLDNEAPSEQDRRVIHRHLRENRPALAKYDLDEKLGKLLDSPRSSGQLRDMLRHQIRTTVLEQAEITVESGPDGTTTSVELRTARHPEPAPMAPASVAVRVLARGVQVLPNHAQTRYQEELCSELLELVESGASRRQQVIFTLRLFVRMWSLRRALRAPSWREEQAG